MSRLSASKHTRGQVHPVPAVVAVLVLTLALTAYSTVVAPLPTQREPSTAVPALKRVESAATTGATLDPALLDPDAADLDGYRVHAELRTPDGRFAVGQTPPDLASVASASASVAVATDNRTVPGTLTVEVWPWTEA